MLRGAAARWVGLAAAVALAALAGFGRPAAAQNPAEVQRQYQEQQRERQERERLEQQKREEQRKHDDHLRQLERDGPGTATQTAPLNDAAAYGAAIALYALIQSARQPDMAYAVRETQRRRMGYAFGTCFSTGYVKPVDPFEARMQAAHAARDAREMQRVMREQQQHREEQQKRLAAMTMAERYQAAADAGAEPLALTNACQCVAARAVQQLPDAHWPASMPTAGGPPIFPWNGMDPERLRPVFAPCAKPGYAWGDLAWLLK